VHSARTAALIVNLDIPRPYSAHSLSANSRWYMTTPESKSMSSRRNVISDEM